MASQANPKRWWRNLLSNSSSRKSRRKSEKRCLRFDQLEERRLLTASLASDLSDYAPGSTARLTAAGFQQGETVRFQVSHNDGTPDTGSGHEAWLVADGSVDDLDGTADGSVITSWYVNPDDSQGSSFEATAFGVLSCAEARTTFTDDIHVAVSVSVSPSRKDENSGGSFVYTFTRNNSSGSLTANFSIGGTATLNTDYSVTGGSGSGTTRTVTFASGSSSAQVSVAPTGDNLVEADETVILRVLDGSGYDPGGTDTATGTIENDDSATISISSPSASENSGPLTFVVSISNPVDVDISLKANSSNGTATTSDSDYTAVSNRTVSFSSGSTTSQNVAVTLTGDNKVERNETLAMILSNLSASGRNVEFSGDNSTLSGTGTINNDDLATISISSPSSTEGSSLTFVVSIDNPVDAAISMDIASADGTASVADSDYTAVGSRSLSFSAGSTTSQNVVVNTTSDNKVELNETLSMILVSLSASGRNVTFAGAGSTVTGTGTIQNDDSATVSISRPSVNENSGPLTFVVSISNPVDVAVSMTANSADGTATTSDGDYTAVNNRSVIFAAGSTIGQNVTVTPTADDKVELNETLSMILSSLSAGGRSVTFADAGSTVSGTGTIQNDDSATVSISSPSVNENSGPLTFVVSISNPVDVAVSMAADSADGTATIADSDYTAVNNGSVSFSAGSTTRQDVSVTLTGDSKVELDETLSMILSSLSASGRSVTFAGAGSTVSGTGTIQNDDSATVSISSPSVNENSGPLTFVVSISNPVDVAVSMTADSADGTATIADSDYTAVNNGSVSFSAGSTTRQDVSVTLTGDSKVELDETLSMILSSLSASGRSVTFAGAGLTVSGTGTIQNDDSATVSISSPSAIEDGGKLTFVVSISNPVDVSVSMTANSADGTATVADNDYTAINGQSVSFTAGSTANQNIEVTVTADKKVERDETLSMILSGLSAGGRSVTFAGGGATVTGSGTIVDDDVKNLVLGTDASSKTGPYVQVISKNGVTLAKFLAYESTFRGGVRVAQADLTGDGIDEIITAPGRGRAPEIRVFTLNGVQLTAFNTMAYAANMIEGVQIAVGDVNGDGRNDIVTAPSRGKSEIRVFRNQYGSSADPIANEPYRSFVAFPASFIGGAVVAVADMGRMVGANFVGAADGSTLDGCGEIIVASSSGMRATVNIYDATSAVPKLVRTILPFSSSFTGGVASIGVGCANNADKIPDLVIGAANGGSSLVEVRSGANGGLLTSINAYTDSSKKAPARVTVRDVNLDGVLDEIWTAQGTDGKTRQIKRFRLNGSAVDSVLENDVNFRGEYFIA